MKKLLLTGFFAVFTFCFIQAQGINFGIKAGVNLSKLQSSNTPIDEISKTRTAFHFGGLAELRLSQLFALETQLLYFQQGGKIEINYIPIEPPGEINQPYEPDPYLPTTAGEAKSNYDYLNLPVLAKLYVYEGLNVYGGPQISMLLSAKDKYESDEVDVEDQIDPFDFGLLGGIGYQLDMGLFLTASYYWGLNNISSIDYSNVLGYDINIHQGVFQFSTGYRF